MGSRIISAVLATAAALGIGLSSTSSADDESPERKLTENAVVRLEPKRSEEIGLRIAKAGGTTNGDQLRLTGEVRLNRDRTAKLMPHIQGFLSELHAREGSRVKRGEPLATITSYKVGEYYANYNTALEEEALEKSNWEMAQRLMERNAISRREYLQCKNLYAAAIVRRRHAEELLESLLPNSEKGAPSDSPGAPPIIRLTYDLVAPFDGVVIEKAATLGENFAEDNTRHVFVVSDLDHPWIEVAATPADLLRIRTGMSATIVDGASGGRHSGTVVWKSGVLNRETGSGFVRIEAENRDDRLRPGQVVAAEIDLNSLAEPVATAAEALLRDGGEFFVFVPAESGRFVARRVRPGHARDDGTIEILSGLARGEAYVEKGAQELLRLWQEAEAAAR